MNREIKFRAWNGSSMEYNVIAGRFGSFFVNPGKKGDGLNENDSACLTTFNTKYSTETPVMQFTGLKDKHGVEIYEGDILHLYYPYKFYGAVHKELKTVQIQFENGCFWFVGGGITDCNWHFYNDSDREVIGNIYENPELIEK